MYCTQCGCLNPEENKICQNCGAELKKRETSILEQPAAVDGAYAPHLAATPAGGSFVPTSEPGVQPGGATEAVQLSKPAEAVQLSKSTEQTEAAAQMNLSAFSQEGSVSVANVEPDGAVQSGAVSALNAGPDGAVQPGSVSAANSQGMTPPATNSNPAFSPVQPPYSTNTNNNRSYIPSEPPKKKSSPVGLFIVLGIAAVLLFCVIGFAIAYLNRPILKIDKAMEKGDIDQVVSLYPRIENDDDQEYVQKQMYSYARYVSRNYREGKIPYLEASEQLDKIGDKILKKYPGFEDVVDSVNELYESRENFRMAEEAFQNEDYSRARDLYELVSSEDNNYQTAKERLKEIRELNVPGLTGEWAMTMDVGKYVLEEMGIDSLEYSLSFTFDIIYEFDDDGYFYTSVDEDSLMENKQRFVDFMAEYIYSEFESESGMSRDQIDEMFQEFYGYSAIDYVMEQADMDSVFEEIQNSLGKNEFRYSVNGDIITFTSSGGAPNELKYEIDGDKLILDSADSSSLKSLQEAMLEQLGYDFPLTFTRRE